GRPGWRDVFFPIRAYLGILRHGLPALKQALVGGQYDFPKGLFFGGHGPCRSHTVLADRMRGWLGPAGAGVHLDFHTGLGPWGTDKLLMDTAMDPAPRGRLDRGVGPGQAAEEHADEPGPPRTSGPVVRAGDMGGRQRGGALVPAAGRVRTLVRGPGVRPGLFVRGRRVRDLRRDHDPVRATGREP